jgi:hypothetical protein
VKRVAVLLLAGACAAPPPERAFVWPAETFFRPGRSFAGFPTSWLADADAGVLRVQPAYADGEPAAYVVSEVWEAHPDVWVQPVYALPSQVETLFGVGTDSTFYSPFWRAWVVVESVVGETYSHVAQVAKLEKRKGPLIVCPIVPEGVGLSHQSHPYTGARLEEPGRGVAYVNGVKVHYLDLGKDRQVASPYEGEADGVVEPADLYFFARPASDGGRELLLDVPAVLPEDATHHAYVRRVDVVLGAEAVFVPSEHPAITAAVAEEYRGRVAKYVDGGCFDDPVTFPGSCAWLDSEGAIEAGVPAWRIVETNVTLTATRRVFVP